MTPRTSFVGREPQLQQVNHLLSTTRLLTLTGAGGCGKTRLALRAATDLERDGQTGSLSSNSPPPAWLARGQRGSRAGRPRGA